MRWLRALDLLRAPSGARVLDVGCAFGFGTRILARRYEAFGVDSSPAFLRRARGANGFALARAERLPFENESFDAVVCLEVLEHLADETVAVGEIRRVLKNAGELVLSVPHRGPLAALDSLNVFLTLTGRQLAFPMGEAPGGSRWHRHYAVRDLERLLVGFEIDRVQLTGVGLSEIVNIGLLALCFGLLKSARAYEMLQNVYFALAVAEDDLPLGAQAYNVMVHARKAAAAAAEAPPS